MNELTVPVIDLQAGIQGIAQALRALPQAEFPLIEFVLDGVYYRAVLIRAGNCLVGKRHRGPTNNLCFGNLLVTTDEGVRHLKGFHRIAAAGGVQRAGFALEDTIWVCAHQTDETDLTKMEALFTYPMDWELEAPLQQHYLKEC